MTLEKLAGKEKGRGVLQRKVQCRRRDADHRLKERELDLREVVEAIVEQAVQSAEETESLRDPVRVRQPGHRGNRPRATGWPP